MKYLIDYNMKGAGDWTSCCPICGLHFRIHFDNSTFEEAVKYLSSPSAKNKRIWKDNKDKIINNFAKFKKIEKYTYSKYNKITLLLPNSVVKHGVKYDDNVEFIGSTKKYGEVYFNSPLYDDGTRGLPMHTECWNLAKNKFNHELKFENFLFNKYIPTSNTFSQIGNFMFRTINYGPVLKYANQDWFDNLYNIKADAFLLNEKEWYLLYLPSGNSTESQKNSKRIGGIIEKIIKGIKTPKIEIISKEIVSKKLNKDRPSPSESATQFKEGIKKKGNDGNMYIVSVNKNEVKRWKKFN